MEFESASEALQMLNGSAHVISALPLETGSKAAFYSSASFALSGWRLRPLVKGAVKSKVNGSQRPAF